MGVGCVSFDCRRVVIGVCYFVVFVVLYCLLGICNRLRLVILFLCVCIEKLFVGKIKYGWRGKYVKISPIQYKGTKYKNTKIQNNKGTKEQKRGVGG